MPRLLVVLVGLALSAPALAVTSRPVVSVPSTSPFVVRGARFQPQERIRVVVFARRIGRSTVTAGANGGFVARFPGLSPTACGGYTVRATGDRGSQAAVKVMPECPPPIAP